VEALCDALKQGVFKRVVVMAGAGISVSAGIPDFRTPGTGLYSQLEHFNLEHPEDIFTLSFFRENPLPFSMLAKGLFPGQFAPTLTHHFIKWLADRGWLQRCFTQNIDGLEAIAGVDPGMVLTVT
jgi:NAD-dependent SIR2 family protein deacetylase